MFPAFPLSSIVRAEGLEKTFAAAGGGPGVSAVQAVDFDVAHGEFVAITGASGSGKSTLLHMLGGITRPSAGRVLRFLRGFAHAEATVAAGAGLGRERHVATDRVAGQALELGDVLVHASAFALAA